MNRSDLLTSLKMDLGIYGLKLPFENPDEAINQVISLRTLPVFSTYHPYRQEREYELESFNAIKTDYNHSIYIIPEIFDREIISVLSVRNIAYFGAYGAPYPANKTAGYGAIESMMNMQLSADLNSLVSPAISHKFESPNKLHLYNFPHKYGPVTITFATVHTENLQSISLSAWESFYKLALLDVKRMLYNSMKHYTEIQSAFGNVNLKIDDWSNAESDRADLLNNWDDSFHLDLESVYIT